MSGSTTPDSSGIPPDGHAVFSTRVPLLVLWTILAAIIALTAGTFYWKGTVDTRLDQFEKTVDDGFAEIEAKLDKLLEHRYAELDTVIRTAITMLEPLDFQAGKPNVSAVNEVLRQRMDAGFAVQEQDVDRVWAARFSPVEKEQLLKGPAPPVVEK